MVSSRGLSASEMGLLLSDALPEVEWTHGDDLCDCVFQRIGSWTNPYLGQTLRVRMCCIWDRIYRDNPDLVELIPGYHNENTGEFETEPAEWDGDGDMPRALWHRQISIETGKPLAVVREQFRNMEPPKAVERGNMDGRVGRATTDVPRRTLRSKSLARRGAS